MLLNVIELGPETEPNSPISDHQALPPVVFIHGLFGRARNFGFLQRKVAKTRRTLALDLRNHGESPHGPTDYSTMAADVFETLMARDAVPATIIGHSMGGKTAMMLALTHADQVHSLLVADIAPAGGGFDQSSSLAADLAALPFPAHLTRAEADTWLAQVIESKPVRELMLQNLALGDNPHWQIGIHEIAAAMETIIGWPEMADGTQYAGRTLFIKGELSGYIKERNYPEMRRLFPEYRMETIENAGHWVHAENPKAFLELLEQFIAE